VRVIKPLQISLQTRSFGWGGKNHLSVSYLLGFRFGSTPEVLLEQDLWQFLTDQLGKDAMLDVCMPKPQGEVLVYGSYYAPQGELVTADRVELLVGELHKSLAIIGDRYWRPLIGPTPPETFSQMPIDYKHAFGGKNYAFNTIGKGMEEIDVLGEMRLPLPNIENPDHLITNSKQRPEPAGFAPLDMMWQQRASKMGTYDDNWKQNYFPGYPPDIDWTHFMCAPNDQWIDEFWRGDENFSVLNMHPEKPELHGSLPAFRSRCFVEKSQQSQFNEVEMKPETLFLFPAVETGILLYRGTIEVEQEDATDIHNLLVAYEDLTQAPRSLGYYEQVLRNRLDENQTFKYMMNTRDIIPDSERCGFAIMLDQAGENDESALTHNINNRAQAEMDKALALLEEQKQALKQQLEQAEIDPAPYMDKFDLSKAKEIDDPMLKAIMETVEKILPGATSGDRKKIQITEVDFSQFDVLQKQIDAMTEANIQEAKVQLLMTIEKVKDSPIEAQVRQKIEAAIVKMDELPDLPRPPGEELFDDIKQQFDHIEETIAVMRLNGVDEEIIPSLDQDLDKIYQQINEAFVQAKDSYRSGAHFVEGKPPHNVPLDIVKHRLMKSLEKGETIAGRDLSGLDLSGMDLSNMDLSGCYLEYANLSHANLSGAKLVQAIITHADLSHANLTGASLNQANLGGSKLVGTDLADADTRGAEFSKADLEGARIINCDLQDANFLETRFTGADLSGSNLANGNFLELDFQGACFVGSILTSCNFVKGQMEKVDFSQAVVDEANFVECVCDGSIFRQSIMNNARFMGGCSIRQCNFNHAILDRANLRETEAEYSSFEQSSFYMADFGGANLQHTKFYGAIGKRATFMKSDLTGADLSSVNLMEGSLMKARLTNADLRYSNLYAVEFMQATVGGTDFRDANLDMSKLEHWSPPHDV